MDISQARAEAQKLAKAREFARARALLESALLTAPNDADMRLQLALTCRAQGDLAAALKALDATLALNPYEFLALLAKGEVLEQMGDRARAAESYRAALKTAPTQPAAIFLPKLEHARAVIAAEEDALNAHLKSSVAALRADFSSEDLRRFDECLDIFSGKAKPFVQEPAFLTFPRLPAEPFLNDSHFPWMAQLEAETEAIRAEALAVMREDWGVFHPYIQKEPGAPVNQWAELNYNPAWSTYDLWKDGAKIEANCARCPQTSAILERIPMADQPGYAPTAVFSVLQPHTRIPPHTGSSNTRVLLHLPLIVP
ncbi:MAG: aspartyl/asparaginyl beta-hydroxylase domain-containing protein, partial [Hyphomonadaceae bacterium]